ncbi:DNA replication and repair protein RecF [Zafaria cholistanensis]|uniref:DNA replication and repair protein RecF n=1 Tax=Zafaria cholistanensis TaxID=1682741 RepID=A0A5A7NTA9_9MICC|nr:DNA replication/repair protein RecF [Zafaria cholistanensis]GER22971.1 DNA replication and repair protein RecF [Zafaria cholistanensis]
MYISHLSLTDFRSYAQADFELGPGTTVFVGSNGVGKTNIAEAIGYLASLSSHRVSTDAPLIRFGAERALVRARVARGGQATAVELEITAGKANRARINRANPVRARDILGIVRTVLFAPEDLALVKGDPANRRRFLDDLMVALRPHHAATRGDYERVLKQRNALLKSARSGRYTAAHESTLEVWDQHLAQAGARLLRGRLDVLELLSAHLGTEYAGLTDGSKAATARYRCTVVEELDDDGGTAALPATALPPSAIPSASQDRDRQDPAGGTREAGAVRAPGLEGAGIGDLERMFLEALAAHRKKETERGITLVGPHRDELDLFLGPAPAKGYASHGETWSLALALRLASYRVLGEDDPREGAGPILILDDVFAELDADRRSRLAAVVAGAEQVIVTAAVAADVPSELGGRVLRVTPGHVSP